RPGVRADRIRRAFPAGHRSGGMEPAAPPRRDRPAEPGAGSVERALPASRAGEELQDQVHDADQREPRQVRRVREPPVGFSGVLYPVPGKLHPQGPRCAAGAGGNRVPAEQEKRAMKSWSIGEVARFLGVKPHVIRYWESELPLLSPRKSLSGRREYTGNEIRLLLRFRHLLYDKKFTIEGAKGRLWEELGASADPDLAARFSEMRTDLIDALMTVRRAHGGNSMSEGEDMQNNSASSRKENPGRPPMGNSLPLAPDNSASSRKDIKERLKLMGQEHLFAHWPARPEQMKKRLLEDLAGLDLGLVQQLRARLTQEETAPDTPPVSADLVPAPYVSLSQSSADHEAAELGEDRIRRGRTAFLTVAGGQGSRLGFDGPKGMFPVTPLRHLTLFAWFAEKLLAARRRYGVDIPWLIMTGPQNDHATQEYFEKQDWFGLGCDTVRLFMQGSLPSLSPEGRLLQGPDGGLLVNPDGHGGVIDALRRSGSLAAMQERGVEQLFYWQVDNP